jgi:hypothetical protein
MIVYPKIFLEYPRNISFEYIYIYNQINTTIQCYANICLKNLPHNMSRLNNLPKNLEIIIIDKNISYNV